MTSKWKTVKLSEVCTIRYGKDYKELKQGSIPVYGSGGIICNVDTSIHNKKSVLIPRKGTLSNLFLVDPPFWTVDTIFWTDINTQKILPEFLFYQLKTMDLASRNVGTAVPSLTTSLLNDLIITLPTIEEQKRLISLLVAFDSKIYINKKINDNLQLQARAIFKEWFIKSLQNGDTIETEFGMLPSGFSTKKVGELPIVVTDYVANGSFASLKANVQLYQEPNYAYFIRNTDLKSDTFEVFVDEHSYNFLSKSRLFGGEIIISNVGDVGSVFLCPTLDAPMTLGNNIIMLKSECDELRYYLYIWFKWSLGQELMQGIKGGSVQPKFNKTDFKALSVILPPQELLHKFHLVVSPMFETIKKNKSEVRHLASLRDTLLPKLMSGEIDVSAVRL